MKYLLFLVVFILAIIGLVLEFIAHPVVVLDLIIESIDELITKILKI